MKEKKFRGSVQKHFSQQDEVWVMTQNFDSTFVWLVQHRMLNLIPECSDCKIALRMTLTKRDENFDGRWYICTSCLMRKGIRFGSFTEDFNCTLMELVRVIFYYFCRGYQVDVVCKELGSETPVGKRMGLSMSKQMILGVFTLMREIISERVIRDLRKAKLGGPGKEVWFDTYKLSLSTNSGVDEFWIVGFIEKETSRARAYLTSDIKIDTIALFIAKTVAKHTTLCSPYYHQVGWEFIDKFYDHQRLKRESDKKQRKAAGMQQSGFEYMWSLIRELELVFSKLREKTKRLRRIKMLL